MGRGCCSRRHHPARTAIIQVGARSALAQCRDKVEPFCRVAAVVVELDMPLRGEHREIVEKRSLFG
jgi:hypothetical protein